MNKKIITIIIATIFLIAGALFFLTSKNQNFFHRKNFAQLTPPPTLPLAKINAKPGTDGTKPISFPAFNISFRIPSDLKTIKQIDPTSEDTLIGSDIISLYTPGSTIDTKKHIQSAGTKLTITLTKNKSTFTNKSTIIPTTSVKEATTDNTLILTATTSALLTKNMMRVYSFPSEDGNEWVYYIEAHIKRKNDTVGLALYCIDYSSSKESPTCQKLLQGLIPTIHNT